MNVFFHSSHLIFFAGSEEFSGFETKSSIALITDGNGYHGLVEEGASLVNVTPPIRIERADSHELLCNIFVLQDGVRDDKSPFEVSNQKLLKRSAQKGPNLCSFSKLVGTHTNGA